MTTPERYAPSGLSNGGEQRIEHDQEIALGFVEVIRKATLVALGREQYFSLDAVPAGLEHHPLALTVHVLSMLRAGSLSSERQR